MPRIQRPNVEWSWKLPKPRPAGRDAIAEVNAALHTIAHLTSGPCYPHHSLLLIERANNVWLRMWFRLNLFNPKRLSAADKRFIPLPGLAVSYDDLHYIHAIDGPQAIGARKTENVKPT